MREEYEDLPCELSWPKGSPPASEPGALARALERPSPFSSAPKPGRPGLAGAPARRSQRSRSCPAYALAAPERPEEPGVELLSPLTKWARVGVIDDLDPKAPKLDREGG